jgi:hypothetical protein
MNSQRLKDAYPQWEPPEEYRKIWRGRMRIVGPRRARKLRRRGVPLVRSVAVTSHGQHRHAWFSGGPTSMSPLGPKPDTASRSSSSRATRSTAVTSAPPCAFR